MTIYTRTGDQGETDLLRGGRVPKDAARLEVCGAFDELDAWLGLARCEPLPEGAAALLERIQSRMVDLRAALATVSPTQSGGRHHLAGRRFHRASHRPLRRNA